LEDRRSEDNKISRGVWKAVKAGTREVRLGKTERRRSQERRNERFVMIMKRQQDQKKRQKIWCLRNFING